MLLMLLIKNDLGKFAQFILSSAVCDNFLRSKYTAEYFVS